MPRILLFTGEGKGKTTAALGCVLRAAGHGMRCLVMQFIKHDRATGEFPVLRGLAGVEMAQCGLGFVPAPDSPDFALHRAAARAGLERVARELRTGARALYVLDEICPALSSGLLRVEGVLRVLDGARADAIIILTGRGAPADLVERADTVTEMTCVKHGFAAGIRAQPGVER